jgi:hypothetical protein
MGSIPSQPHLSLALLDRRRGPKPLVNPVGIDQVKSIKREGGARVAK